MPGSSNDNVPSSDKDTFRIESIGEVELVPREMSSVTQSVEGEDGEIEKSRMGCSRFNREGLDEVEGVEEGSKRESGTNSNAVDLFTSERVSKSHSGLEIREKINPEVATINPAEGESLSPISANL